MELFNIYIAKEEFIEYLKTLGEKFISAGDYNAKHTFCCWRLLNITGKQFATSYYKMDAQFAGQLTARKKFLTSLTSLF